MTTVRPGTSGYTYPEWKGAFYPAHLPTTRMLHYYGERFSAVEVNYTFRRMPTVKAVKGWAAATPADFVFALKVPQRITHFARLLDVDEPMRLFCDTARTLGRKLGPLLFQLPPTFEKETARLATTLDGVPPAIRCAVEFRHPSWFADDVYRVLRTRNAALCIADNEDGSTPAVSTADWGYLRLRAVEYSDDDLARWVTVMRGVGPKWRDAFVFFKHEDSASGPRLAARFGELVRRESPHAGTPARSDPQGRGPSQRFATSKSRASVNPRRR
jgi:uncharacterized protein YecE (DUF72 family)